MFSNAKYYFNRELSWLKFNQRVLLESIDTNTPLLERLRFIAIASSNLDDSRSWLTSSSDQWYC